MTRERAEKRVSDLESRRAAEPEPTFPYAEHPPLADLHGLEHEWYSALARHAGVDDYREIPSDASYEVVRAVRTHDPALFDRVTEAMLIWSGCEGDESNLTRPELRRLEELNDVY